MGNKETKLPKENQKIRFLRKNFNLSSQLASLDIETVTPESSPRYRITIKDRGLRTKHNKVKNRRQSKEIIETWLEAYPESRIIMFEKSEL